jgi:hypothetical protein
MEREREKKTSRGSLRNSKKKRGKKRRDREREKRGRKGEKGVLINRNAK